LTNAPATFNRMMERIFRPHRNFTGVFFDDVIIYSKTIEEHKEHLKVIFQALRDNKLYVNQKKSEFFLQEIQYLGHII
ncbi:reverse transcriptase family protein, partial [Salmonella enterica]|uniref:reverse transcriptase family protein n=1 Tax=Salmonella enterica TaxID=28901 RepID=UPI003CF0C214